MWWCCCVAMGTFCTRKKTRYFLSSMCPILAAPGDQHEALALHYPHTLLPAWASKQSCLALHFDSIQLLINHSTSPLHCLHCQQHPANLHNQRDVAKFQTTSCECMRARRKLALEEASYILGGCIASKHPINDIAHCMLHARLQNQERGGWGELKPVSGVPYLIDTIVIGQITILILCYVMTLQNQFGWQDLQDWLTWLTGWRCTNSKCKMDPNTAQVIHHLIVQTDDNLATKQWCTPNNLPPSWHP